MTFETVVSKEQKQLFEAVLKEDQEKAPLKIVAPLVRYLVYFHEHLVAAVAYAACAWAFADREKFIGWSQEQKNEELKQVASLSYLHARLKCLGLETELIRRSVPMMIQNLEVLGREVPVLLEALALPETEESWFKNAGWTCIGSTAGRGRNDRNRTAGFSKKKIFIFALDENFREKLHVEVNPGLQSTFDGLDSEHFVENEFGGCDLGDERRNRTLCTIAKLFLNNPGETVCNMTGKNRNLQNQIYNFLSNNKRGKNRKGCTEENILEQHVKRTQERIKFTKVVGYIQDTTECNYTTKVHCEGLNEIGKSPNGKIMYGIKIHTMLVIDDKGEILGINHVSFLESELRSEEEKKNPNITPIVERESMKWVDGFNAAAKIAEKYQNALHVCIGDRESDFAFLFCIQYSNPHMHILVRAKHDRNLENKKVKLFDVMKSLDPQAEIDITVPRVTSRTRKIECENNRNNIIFKSRKTKIRLSSKKVTMKIPLNVRDFFGIDYNTLNINCVYAYESTVEEGVEPIEWFLLTSLPIETPNDVLFVLKTYRLRWRIEEYFRILKVVYKIEKYSYGNILSLKKLIAIFMILSWRVAILRSCYREHPELPAEIFFSESEISLLKLYAESNGDEFNGSTKEAIEKIADLGGYTGRSNDLPPGSEILSKGMSRFSYIQLGANLVKIKISNIICENVKNLRKNILHLEKIVLSQLSKASEGFLQTTEAFFEINKIVSELSV
ncbi:MAG: IS4 family transposase [Desulfovibrio sp.]|nr:IS4 family transposase [Desulfovibrio sp.]